MLAPAPVPVPAALPPTLEALAPQRRLRRLVAYGPRCPDCAGPLAFGEGCSLCPICGYSSCATRP